MPAVSQAQQRYFGMIEAGKIARPKNMKEADVKAFAATPRKGLPRRKAPTTRDHARAIAQSALSRQRSAPAAARGYAARAAARK